MMVEIRRYFENMVPMSDSDWDIFSSKLVQRNFAKKEPLLKMGQTENYLSFIASGTVRLFIPAPDHDLTFAFAFESEFVSAYDSFLTRKACHYEVQALSPTVVFSISHNHLQEVYKTSQIGNVIGRMAAEDLFLKKSEREWSLLQDTAEERYLKLFKERPEIVKNIPLQYIASYIGVTPQALSRIRKRIS